MKPSLHILAFSTSNYDAMTKFLADFGFEVIKDPHDQLTPLFEHGRASRVRRDDFEFNLEESAIGGRKSAFNLFLPDFSAEQLERVKALGYKFEHAAGLYGDSYTFETPDGGKFVVT